MTSTKRVLKTTKEWNIQETFYSRKETVYINQLTTDCINLSLVMKGSRRFAIHARQITARYCPIILTLNLKDQ